MRSHEPTAHSAGTAEGQNFFGVPVVIQGHLKKKFLLLSERKIRGSSGTPDTPGSAGSVLLYFCAALIPLIRQDFHG